MNVVVCAFFGMVVLAWCTVLMYDNKLNEDGERVDCSLRRTRTAQQRLDRLYDLACFPANRVRWRHHFLVGVAASATSTILLVSAGVRLNPILIFLSSFLPFFVSGYFVENFNRYHGQHKNHPLLAHHLRVALERDLVIHSE